MVKHFFERDKGIQGHSRQTERVYRTLYQFPAQYKTEGNISVSMRTCCLWLGFIFANCVLLIQVKNGWNKGATMFVNGIPAINEPTLGVDYYPEQWDTNEMMKVNTC